MTDKLVNFLIFQVAWFACALGAGNDIPEAGVLVLAALLIVHFRIHTRNMIRDSIYIVLVGLVGFTIDSLLSMFGVLNFKDTLYAPLWLLMLWMVFATTIFYSLEWLHNRYWLAGILGALGGPLSYYGGSKFDALQLGDNILLSMVVISICWFMIVPLMLKLSQLSVCLNQKIIIASSQ